MPSLSSLGTERVSPTKDGDQLQLPPLFPVPSSQYSRNFRQRTYALQRGPGIPLTYPSAYGVETPFAQGLPYRSEFTDLRLAPLREPGAAGMRKSSDTSMHPPCHPPLPPISALLAPTPLAARNRRLHRVVQMPYPLSMALRDESIPPPLISSSIKYRQKIPQACEACCKRGSVVRVSFDPFTTLNARALTPSCTVQLS